MWYKYYTMATEAVEKLKKVPREILGVTELRRNPQKAFDLAKRRGLPILVTEFNKPQGIILSLKTFDDVVEALNRLEIEDALDSVEIYQREKEKGTLRKLSSLENLVENEG